MRLPLTVKSSRAPIYDEEDERLRDKCAVDVACSQDGLLMKSWQ